MRGMTQPLSLDLRKRIVRARKTGATYEAIAEQFSVGRASVSRLLRRSRQRKGRLEPEPHAGGQACLISPEQHALVRALVAEEPDRTAQALCDLWQARTGVIVSRATMYRLLQRLDLTWKKNSSRRASNSRNASKPKGATSPGRSRKSSGTGSSSSTSRASISR